MHVITRGGGRLNEVEERHGVIVHRVREPEFPKDDLDAFIAWVDHMNDDMLARGLDLGGGFDLIHSHDWLLAPGPPPPAPPPPAPLLDPPDPPPPAPPP